MSYVTESEICVKSYEYWNLWRAYIAQFRTSRYTMSPNRSFEWKVRTIWISGLLPLFNFERLDILCPRIRHLCEKLGPFKFLESFCCSISSISIYYVPESVFCVKSEDHSNFWTASVVQFRASWYIMSPNRTSMWKVMTIRISRKLQLFNFERLYILCPPIQTSMWKVMTIRILESFRCSISSV